MAQQRYEGPDGTIYEALPDGGYAIVSGPSQAQPYTIGTPDPAAQYEAPKAAVDLGNARLTGQRTQQQMALDAMTAPAQAAKATADAAAAQLAVQKAQRDLAAPNTTQQEKTDRVSRLNQLARQINRTQSLYDTSIGTTKGLGGLQDYLPTDDNRRFDVAGAALSQQGLAAFRVPGTGTVSDRDAMMFDRANLPSASTRDAAIEEQLLGLRSRVDEERKALGLPAQDWSQQASSAPAIGTPPQPQRQEAIPGARGPAYFDAGTGPGGPTLNGGGSQQRVADPTKAGVAARLNELLRSGAPDARVKEYATSVGASPESLNAVLAFRRQNPGYRGNYNASDLELKNEDVGLFRGLVNTGAQSPIGAYFLSGADALTARNLDSLTDNPALARAGLRGVQQANPYSSLAGTVTGSGLAAAGAELGLARVGLGAGAAALTGDALYGAAYGAGASDEGSRFLGAAVGGVGGLGGGIAGRAAIRGIGNLGRGRFGLPQESNVSRGERIAVDALRDDGFDPLQAVNSVRDARSMGIPSIPADLGDNARGAFSSLARQPGEGRSILRDIAIQRQGGQGDRIRSAITEDLGPITNIRQQSDALIEQARAAAKPLYARAYQTPVPSTPELDAVLGTPFGRQAVGRARTIAANERRSPSELNFALDADGNPVLNPQPMGLMADHLMARQHLDAAQEAYRAARNGQGSVEQARDAVLQAREAERAARIAVERAPDPSQAASVPTFTTQTLDYVKRGMDDILEEQRNPVTGRLVLDEAGRAQNGVRAQLLGEVDRLNPSFAQARQAYAGPAGEREALELGRKALNMSTEDVQALAGRLPPSQRQQFDLGYRTALSDALDARVDGADKVSALVGTPKKREVLSQITGNSQGFNRFNQRLDAEQAANETYRAVATGSPTASRLADDAIIGSDQQMAGNLLRAGQAFRSGGAVGGGLSLALDAGRNALAYGFGKKAAAARQQAATLLSDPEALAATAKVLSRNDAVRRINDRAIRKATQIPQRIGGLFGAPLLAQQALLLGGSQ